VEYPDNRPCSYVKARRCPGSPCSR
jgi:hypothetical protein